MNRISSRSPSKSSLDWRKAGKDTVPVKIFDQNQSKSSNQAQGEQDMHAAFNSRRINEARLGSRKMQDRDRRNPDFGHNQSSFDNNTLWVDSSADQVTRGIREYSSDDYEQEYGSGHVLDLDEEDAQVDMIKQEIKFIKQESLTSTENALRIAAQAEETAKGTLLNLGLQSEKIGNAERDIDLSKINQDRAEEKAHELKRLNRSMFAVHISKPWGKSKRAQAEEERVRLRHEMERSELDANRHYVYNSQKRIDQVVSQNSTLNFNPFKKTKDLDKKQESILEKSKYQFEADSEDEFNERQIDHNLDQIGNAAARLHGLAKVTGLEIDHQNKKLGELQDKSDSLDSTMFINTKRLHNMH